MASTLDQERPQVRVPLSWMALLAFVITSLLGAMVWVGPTWLQVAQTLDAPKSSPLAHLAPTPEKGPPVLDRTEAALALDAGGAAASRLAATRSIVKLWGAPVETLKDVNPSRLIRAAGLRATTLPPALGLLERLDYPFLVVLKKSVTAPRHTVALVALTRTDATILDPLGGKRVLSRRDLLRQVEGKVQVLWKGVPGLSVSLKPRKGKARAVGVLQRALKEQGLYQGQVHGVYDAATRAAIVRLQAEFGIRKTGIFGVRTHMALSKRVLKDETPSLAAPP